MSECHERKQDGRNEMLFSASRQAHQMRLNGIVEMSDRKAESGAANQHIRASATANTRPHNPIASIWQRDKAMN